MGDGVRELLHRLLDVQQRRAGIYGKLQAGFAEYLESKSEIAYKNLCQAVTGDFNSCSREVIEIECALKDQQRDDLAALVRTLQLHEKTKLQMTATLQVLRRVGHPSERNQHQHQHHQQGTCALNCSDASGGHITGLEECVAEAEYLAAQREAVKAIQEAVLSINDLMDTLRYEILED